VDAVVLRTALGRLTDFSDLLARADGARNPVNGDPRSRQAVDGRAEDAVLCLQSKET
jgi:hypothetical protein